MQVKIVALFAVLAMVSTISAVTICNSVALDYELLSYSGIDTCFVGAGTVQSFDIGASHQILALNTTSQKFIYKSIGDLIVGDVVQSVFGTTTITGISVTTISSPFIALGQVFNEDTFSNNQFSPYAVTSLLRWIAVDSSTVVEEFKPTVTDNYIGGVYNIDYWVPMIESEPISTSLGVFSSANVQNIGSFLCNGTSYDFYYYDPSLLLRPLALDTLYRSFKMMSISDYFGMLSYALGQPDGVLYDGRNIVYSYTLNVPTCDALTITTADGYLVVNGLVVS